MYFVDAGGEHSRYYSMVRLQCAIKLFKRDIQGERTTCTAWVVKDLAAFHTIAKSTTISCIMLLFKVITKDVNSMMSFRGYYATRPFPVHPNG